VYCQVAVHLLKVWRCLCFQLSPGLATGIKLIRFFITSIRVVLSKANTRRLFCGQCVPLFFYERGAARLTAHCSLRFAGQLSTHRAPADIVRARGQRSGCQEEVLLRNLLGQKAVRSDNVQAEERQVIDAAS